MTPIPEPSADIAAQFRAALDPDHPKTAVFLAPGNEADMPAELPGCVIVAHPGGTLVTTVTAHAEAYRRHGPDDALMAIILGYPEHKSDAVNRCGGAVHLTASAVQARDADGAVITEAFVSPQMVTETKAALTRHVPVGGALVILTPIEAIARRLKNGASFTRPL